MHDLARAQIDDVDRAVAELGDDQPVARRIERHVIDPPTGVAQHDRLLERQRRARFLGSRRARPRRDREQRRDRSADDAHRTTLACRTFSDQAGVV